MAGREDVLAHLAGGGDSSLLVRTGREARPPPLAPEALTVTGRRGSWSGLAWDDLEVGDLIGQGGMGEVYRARQRSVGRVVALKVLDAGSADDPERRTRFANEARASALIQHPNVVVVHASGEHAGRLYMVLEHLPGGTVADLIADKIATGGRFAPREAVGLVLQAARGLAAAHACGLVHRDLKPANLLLAADGSVKVADFGLVRFLAGEALTLSGTILGTPRYIAPEQGRGQPAGPASDIYSLGVVFYELLTLRPPFDGTTSEELIVQHNYREPPLPSGLNPDVPADVQAVCIACLRKDPAARFADAAGLVTDLERLEGGMAPLSAVFPAGRVETGADSALRRIAGRRRWWPLAAGVLVAFALAGGWWWWDARKTAVGALRQRLEPLALATGVPATAEEDLAALERLAGAGETMVRQGRARLAEVAALRDSLAGLFAGAVIPDLAAAVGGLARLAVLMPDEPRLAVWSRRLAAETAAIAADRTLIGRLAATGGGLTREQRQGLAGAMAGLAARGEPRDPAAQARLDEAERSERDLAGRAVTAIRRRPQPGDEADLDRFAAVAGGEDPRVQAWRDQRRQVAELSARLGPATQAIPPPGAAADCRALAALAGADDPQVAGWTARFAAADRQRAALMAVFEAVAPIPATAGTDLDTFAGLVGPADPDLLRWRARLAAWRDLAQGLDGLQSAWVLGPEALAAAEASLAQAVAMVGAEAGPVAAWRRRLAELAGPARPAWAAEAGRDQHGPWLLLRVGAASQRMRWLPPGTLILGSPQAEAGRDPDEGQVRVRLSAGRWLADSECSRALWHAVVGGAPDGDGGLPVAEVSAGEAMEFCAALGRALPGLRAQLPSEAVWEAAARAGTDGAWGGLAAAQAATAIVHDTTAPQPVDGGMRNALGFAHLPGNVREWCRDGYGPLPVGELVEDPCAPPAARQVVRGGSWGDRLSACRAANRAGQDPDLRSAYLGFRFEATP